jgi:hypothetical protein
MQSDLGPSDSEESEGVVGSTDTYNLSFLPFILQRREQVEGGLALNPAVAAAGILFHTKIQLHNVIIIQRQ